MNLDPVRLFHQLHQSGLLILPNAWDPGSARIVQHAGAKAIATSSAALAWAHGLPDGEALPQETLIASVREIVRAVGIPVSADVESGYASDAKAVGAFTAKIVDVGAVGINIEDGTGPPDLLAAKIDRIKEVSSKAGVDLWVNARVDVYLLKLKEGEAAYQEATARADRYRAAGANSIFVPAAAGEPLIARLVQSVALPLNILAWPGVPSAKRLEELGVRRLSAGSGIAKVALGRVYAMSKSFLSDGDSTPFQEGVLQNPEINRLMRRD
jgi:2-methylisocitrate lyase-like PEP mutase family enzyme